MPKLQEAFSDCEIGDIVFETVAHAMPGCERIVVCDPIPAARWGFEPSLCEMAPRIEFVRALATLPDSTAKVRVWKRVL